jgi:ubiquinone biosynthesis protein UbiJ
MTTMGYLVVAVVAALTAVWMLARNARRIANALYRREAKRHWKRYAKRTGKDWRTLTPTEKLEAHGVDVKAVRDGE